MRRTIGAATLVASVLAILPGQATAGRFTCASDQMWTRGATVYAHEGVCMIPAMERVDRVKVMRASSQWKTRCALAHGTPKTAYVRDGLLQKVERRCWFYADDVTAGSEV